MYLSLLSINVGSNPTHPRPGLDWVLNRYRVHQRLCMAYPSADRVSNDPFFLGPYDGNDFYCNGQRRNADNGFLYRIGAVANGVSILVQSATLPNWSYAFQNAGHLLAGIPQVREFHQSYTSGQKLTFRLTANPVKCIGGKSVNSKGQLFTEDWVGRIVPVSPDAIGNWLERRAERHGFAIVDMVEPEVGYVRMDKNRAINLRLAQYNGTLEVIDVDIFLQTLYSGIGRGKSWGFGLLSVKCIPVV